MPSGRSWTDPFTNHTELAGVEVRDNLKQLAGLAETPRSLILPFLHEAAHHWCFISPVGNALALMKARARQRAISVAANEEEDDSSFLLDMIACHVAIELLRPFSEGLALAVELDSLTRKTNYISWPFAAACRAFALSPSDSPVETTMPLNGALMTARRGPSGLRRKINVYTDSIGSRGNGYLLGYLAMRSMMKQLAAKEIRLAEETDLVIGFLRSFFYEDWQLVDALLERDVDWVSLANGIENRIISRFHSIAEVTPDQVRDFERGASTDKDARTDKRYASALRYDATFADRGAARLSALYDSVMRLPSIGGNEDFQTYAEFLWILDRELLSNRNLVDIGDCQVLIRINNHKCSVTLNGQTILTDLETDLADFSGPGQIDVCYDAHSAGHDRILLISTDSESPELIAVTNHGPVVNSSASLPDINVPRSFARRKIDSFDAFADSRLKDRHGSILDQVKGQLAAIVESCYLGPAMSSVPDKYLDETISALRGAGLKAVLGGDRNLAESLAIAGTVTQAVPLRQAVEAALAHANVPTQTLERLLDISEHSIQLISQQDIWMISHV